MNIEELDAIRRNALSLPLGERAELARDLVASLDGPADANAQAEWDKELCRRINDVRSGEATLLEPEEVLMRIRERLKRI